MVPALLITSGTLTIIVAIFGLGLFKRKYEASGVFLAYASIIGVAFLISLSASVTSFVLREAIAHRFRSMPDAIKISYHPVLRATNVSNSLHTLRISSKVGCFLLL